MKSALEELVKKYPQSDVIGMAKDILALMEQGKTVTKGSTFGNLAAVQQEVAKQTEVQSIPQFTAVRDNRHFVLLPVTSDTIDINRITYKIASYNFSHFMLKDFDLTIRRQADGLRFIVVSDFQSFGDAHFYQETLSEDPSLQKVFNSAAIHPVVISEENLKALQAGQTFSAYLLYYQNTLIPAQAADDHKRTATTIKLN